MWIYIFNIITIPIYYKIIKNKKKFVLLVALQLFLMLALSNVSMGIDNGNYSGGYDYISGLSFSDMISNLRWSGLARLVYPFNFENGYMVLNWIVSRFGIGFQGFLTICAFINIGSVSLFIYKFSKRPWLSFIIYCAFGFFAYDFGILRQSLALSMVLLSFVCLGVGKKLRSVICFLIAISFHRVAIMVLPLLILFNNVRMNKKIFSRLLIVGMVLLILSYPIYQDIVVSFMNFMEKGYVGHEARLNSMFVFFFISSVVTLFMYNFSKVEKGIESVSLYALILAFYLCIFGLYNDVLARSLQFYSIFLLISVPNGLSQYEHWKSMRLIKTIIYLMLVGFMCYEIGKSHLNPYVFSDAPDVTMIVCLVLLVLGVVGVRKALRKKNGQTA